MEQHIFSYSLRYLQSQKEVDTSENPIRQKNNSQIKGQTTPPNRGAEKQLITVHHIIFRSRLYHTYQILLSKILPFYTMYLPIIVANSMPLCQSYAIQGACM